MFREGGVARIVRGPVALYARFVILDSAPLLMAVYRSVPAGAPFKASNDAEQLPKAPPKHRDENDLLAPAKLTLMRESAVSSAIAGSS